MPAHSSLRGDRKCLGTELLDRVDGRPTPTPGGSWDLTDSEAEGLVVQSHTVNSVKSAYGETPDGLVKQI